MRYVMKRKLLTWARDFYIRDAEGRDVFFVDGKAFPLVSRQWSFQTLDRRELAFIRQKLVSWIPTYEIYRNGALAAVVKKKPFTLSRYKFSVDVPGLADLEVSGNFLQHEYTFTRSGQPVAEVSKKWLAWSDTYDVEIVDGEDDLLILATTVVIAVAVY